MKGILPSQVSLERVIWILEDATDRTLKKLHPLNEIDWVQWKQLEAKIKWSLNSFIRETAQLLFEAAEIGPKEFLAVREERVREQIREQEAKQQAKLAKQEAKRETKQQQLNQIKWEIKKYSQVLSRVQKVAMSSEQFQAYYPLVPVEPLLEPTDHGDGLPDHPGVYFLWLESMIYYVGVSSVSLKGRCNLNRHHVLKAHHRITYLEFPSEQSGWAEDFYISILKSPRNVFGERGWGD